MANGHVPHTALGRIACNGPDGRRIAQRLMTHDGARAHSSLRSALSRSRSSGVSVCPCSRMACRTATVRTSSCVPEIASVQFFSLGNRRQSMIFLFGCDVGFSARRYWKEQLYTKTCRTEGNHRTQIRTSLSGGIGRCFGPIRSLGLSP